MDGPVKSSFRRGITRIDKGGVHNRKIVTSTCKVRDIKSELFQVGNLRGGIVPYVKTENGILFCWGVDAPTGEITDFGGGVRRTDPSPMSGCLRELHEESLGVFTDLINDTADDLVTYSDIMMIVFSCIPSELCDTDKVRTSFKSKVGLATQPEVKDIVWLTRDEVVALIKGTHPTLIMYQRVSKFLSVVLDDLLKL